MYAVCTVYIVLCVLCCAVYECKPVLSNLYSIAGYLGVRREMSHLLPVTRYCVICRTSCQGVILAEMCVMMV